MTEDEARKKACCGPPNIATATLAAAAVMTGCAVDGRQGCMGSDCMAWRWDGSALKMDMDAQGVLFRPDRGDTPHGFCGLAGKP